MTPSPNAGPGTNLQCVCRHHTRPFHKGLHPLPEAGQPGSNITGIRKTEVAEVTKEEELIIARCQPSPDSEEIPVAGPQGS